MRRSLVLRPHSSLAFLLALGCLFADRATPSILAAQEAKPAASADAAAKVKGPAAPQGARPVQRWGDKVLAVALWFGIVVVGLVLLTVVMVWGRWLRKLARRKPVPPSAPDPLWYLKTKPRAPAGSAPVDASGHSDDPDSGPDISRQTPL
jgi:hypothetical protein